MGHKFSTIQLTEKPQQQPVKPEPQGYSRALPWTRRPDIALHLWYFHISPHHRSRPARQHQSGRAKRYFLCAICLSIAGFSHIKKNNQKLQILDSQAAYLMGMLYEKGKTLPGTPMWAAGLITLCRWRGRPRKPSEWHRLDTETPPWSPSVQRQWNFCEIIG